ncbi:flagellar biosynthesis protein FliO [Hoeflea halophila]|uniref:Flagellar biosynthesis protein FliO n=1 Tax=Hoeflea halophila TaxID=714899 RepID=A0A286HN41_9HYPH|nr:flagellar biosynthetic protein FliO [Hoeflea halophila]SOE08574.1 flagellar biosynthesis protein FliO [Hoeflea halophila]
MPETLMDGQGATLLTAIAIVGIALLALVGVFWLIRNRAASTFIRGGKNRMPRLAVLDATAVDTRRRLVLIRRDDVEHLVMIGGPTDIVIESRIVPHGMTATPQPQPKPQAQQREQREQRPQQPAPETVRPARAEPQPVDRPDRPTGTGAALTPQDRQQPRSAPLAAAAIAASADDETRSEAADLLETARNRVFEEPVFEETDVDDLRPTPSQTPVQQPPAAGTATASTPEPAQAASASAVTPANDTVQAKAVDVLDTVRNRVFEDPTFDESVFEELTSTPPAADPAPTVRATPVAASVSAAPAAGSGMATGRPVAANEQSPAAASDFETVLAAELSQNLAPEPAQDSLITAHYTEHQLDPEEAERLEAPEVQPETQESRDSLEAEMERLLGDLSRKP